MEKRFISLLVYLLIAGVLFFPVLTHPADTFIGFPGDSQQFMWYLGWFWYAIFHGQNPFLSTYLNYPSGLNLMVNTSVIAESLVFGPLTFILKTVFTYNLIIVINIISVAFFSELILARLGFNRLIAIFSAILIEILPYSSAQMLGHLHLILTSVPIIIVYIILKLVAGDYKRHSLTGALIGFAMALQFYTSTEMFATTLLVALIAYGLSCCFLGIQRPVNYLRKIPINTYLYAMIVCGVMIAPGSYEVLFGPFLSSSSTPLHGRNVYVNDILNFITPTSVYALHNGLTSYIAETFTGDISGDNAYIGVPALVFATWYIVTSWRNASTRILSSLLVIIAILSMGPYLHIYGHTTCIPLPWVLFQHIPFIKEALPQRLMFYGDICLIVLLAKGVQSMSERGERVKQIGYATLCLVVLSWFPEIPYPYTHVSQTASEIENGGSLYKYLRNEPTSIVTNDFPTVMQALADGHYSFPVTNAYGFTQDTSAQTDFRPVSFTETIHGMSDPAIHAYLAALLASTRPKRLLYFNTLDGQIEPNVYKQIQSLCGSPIAETPSMSALVWNVPTTIKAVWFDGQFWNQYDLVSNASESEWAGTNWSIHTRGLKVTVTITAPPKTLLPYGEQITVTGSMTKRVDLLPGQSFQINTESRQDIYIHSSDYFVPSKVLKSNDTRLLSSIVTLQNTK